MPSLSRRRDAADSRADRLESHIRLGEHARGYMVEKQRLPMCDRCKRVFEEQSKHCPFCDKKTMGYVAPIPEQHREQAYQNALRRARRNLGR